MKKLALAITLLIVLSIVLTACTYEEYGGDFSNLYTVAINSVLWLNGYSWSADFVCDPQIEIIDIDEFGRTIFTYHEKHYKGSDLSFTALIVSQGSNEREVFYYEDINFIIKKQPLPAQNVEMFSDEEIECLKSINDWNQQIKHDKCVKKEITKSKSQIPHEQEIKKQIEEEFDFADNKYLLFMDYMINDSTDSKFIIYGYVWKSETDGIYFIGLVETENNTFKKLNMLCPIDVYNYNAEFIEFKNANNWQN